MVNLHYVEDVQYFSELAVRSQFYCKSVEEEETYINSKSFISEQNS